MVARSFLRAFAAVMRSAIDPAVFLIAVSAS